MCAVVLEPEEREEY